MISWCVLLETKPFKKIRGGERRAKFVGESVNVGTTDDLVGPDSGDFSVEIFAGKFLRRFFC
jgi:hypothetical protein